uniref:Two-component response regulator-like APRR7 isoform X1 n=1 Tax=Tanacetum cinerariifolium TaxID=118510 RepID=A0A6L2KAM2_TANCI|nr:two-component response regulator-like APRR7 isoform X1 [Tanacetum cinerariifolium]
MDRGLCAVMSSDDSMGIVFSCLSKGAVDFLVKPIRKNELKNLWQHVWRKCHSVECTRCELTTTTPVCSSVHVNPFRGSESGSGILDDKATKSRSIEE